MSKKPVRITKTTQIDEMAAIVCEALRAEKIDCFLSGGAVVSIYTDNRYESFDLDFITLASHTKIKPILERLGFRQDKSRHFVHPESPYFVEFPGSAIRVGEELITRFEEFRTAFGIARILTPTDCVKDRLAAYYHWNDPQGLEQAIWVCEARSVDLEDVKKWSKNEGYPQKFDEFFRRLANSKRS